MLDVDFAMLRQGFLKNMPIATMLGLLIFVELFIALKASRKSIPLAKKAVDLTITNTEALGLQLYTDYFFAFQISGLILLVAMIGAITLTVRHAKTVRRQNIYEQVTRKREECVKLVQVKVGEGVKV
jgi:NADH-quinone oxidoreductase subunit J